MTLLQLRGSLSGEPTPYRAVVRATVGGGIAEVTTSPTPHLTRTTTATVDAQPLPDTGLLALRRSPSLAPSGRRLPVSRRGGPLTATSPDSGTPPPHWTNPTALRHRVRPVIVAALRQPCSSRWVRGHGTLGSGCSSRKPWQRRCRRHELSASTRSGGGPPGPAATRSHRQHVRVASSTSETCGCAAAGP